MIVKKCATMIAVLFGALSQKACKPLEIKEKPIVIIRTIGCAKVNKKSGVFGYSAKYIIKYS